MPRCHRGSFHAHARTARRHMLACLQFLAPLLPDGVFCSRTRPRPLPITSKWVVVEARNHVEMHACWYACGGRTARPTAFRVTLRPTHTPSAGPCLSASVPHNTAVAHTRRGGGDGGDGGGGGGGGLLWVGCVPPPCLHRHWTAVGPHSSAGSLWSVLTACACCRGLRIGQVGNPWITAGAQCRCAQRHGLASGRHDDRRLPTSCGACSAGATAASMLGGALFLHRAQEPSTRAARSAGASGARTCARHRRRACQHAMHNAQNPWARPLAGMDATMLTGAAPSG